MRGNWSLLLLAVLLGGGIAGCLSDDPPLPSQVPDEPPADLVPRRFGADEAPAAFRFAVPDAEPVEVTYRGTLPGNVSAPPIPLVPVAHNEVARFHIDEHVAADVPVELALEFVSHGWKNLYAHIECADCVIRYPEVRSRAIEGWFETLDWRIWRPADAEAWLVISEHDGLSDYTKPPGEWEVVLRAVPRPTGLVPGFPALIALDPAVPITLNETGGDIDRVLFVDPERGLAGRAVARGGMLQLDAAVEPGLYVVAATGTGVLHMTGGFSGGAVLLGTERVESEHVVAFDSEPVRWSETVERVPWGVGFFVDRAYGIDPGEAQWWIEWRGERIYDTAGGSTFTMHCLVCTHPQGTDMFRVTMGAGEYLFQIDESHSQGKAWAYFSYLQIDEALADYRAGTGVDSA